MTKLEERHIHEWDYSYIVNGFVMCKDTRCVKIKEVELVTVP